MTSARPAFSRHTANGILYAPCVELAICSLNRRLYSSITTNGTEKNKSGMSLKLLQLTAIFNMSYQTPGQSVRGDLILRCELLLFLNRDSLNLGGNLTTQIALFISDP